MIRDPFEVIVAALREEAPGVTMTTEDDAPRRTQLLHVSHNVHDRTVGIQQETLVQAADTGAAQQQVADLVRRSLERIRHEAIDNLGLEPIIQARIDAAVKVEAAKLAAITARLQEQADLTRRHMHELGVDELERRELRAELSGIKAAQAIVRTAADGA